MREMFMRTIGANEKGECKCAGVRALIKWIDGRCHTEVDEDISYIYLNTNMSSITQMQFEFYHCIGQLLYDKQKLSVTTALAWYHRTCGPSSRSMQLAVKMSCDEFALNQMSYMVIPEQVLIDPKFNDIVRELSHEFNPTLIEHIYEQDLHDNEIRRQYMVEVIKHNRPHVRERAPQLSVKAKNELFNSFNALAYEMGYGIPEREKARNPLVTACKHLKIEVTEDEKFVELCKILLANKSELDGTVVKFLEEHYDKFRKSYKVDDRNFNQRLIEKVVPYCVISGNPINNELVADISDSIRGVGKYQETHIVKTVGLKTTTEKNKLRRYKEG